MVRLERVLRRSSELKKDGYFRGSPEQKWSPIHAILVEINFWNFEPLDFSNSHVCHFGNTSSLWWRSTFLILWASCIRRKWSILGGSAGLWPRKPLLWRRGRIARTGLKKSKAHWLLTRRTTLDCRCQCHSWFKNVRSTWSIWQWCATPHH